MTQLVHRRTAKRRARIRPRRQDGALRLADRATGRWTPSSTRDDGSQHGAMAKSIAAGCSRAEPSRTSGFCRESSMARRCGSTTRVSTPGTSCGAIRCGNTTPARSAAPAATTSCRMARRRRRSGALELHRDHAQFVPLDRRTFPDDGKTWQLQADFRARRKS